MIQIMKLCSVPECNRNTHGRKMCVTHRRRIYRGAVLENPIRTRDSSVEFILKWIDIKTNKNPNSGCAEWNGKLDNEGYARVLWRGKRWTVHRLVFHLTSGKEIGENHVLHKCDNPKCCNIDHLWLGTQQDNMRDCVLKGRNSKGENKPSAKLSMIQVDEIRARRATGESTASISKLFPVSLRQIQSILSGEYWKMGQSLMQQQNKQTGRDGVKPL
jgi:hypothetical protein